MLVMLISASIVLGILGAAFGFISAYGPGMSVDENRSDGGKATPSHGAGCGACGAGMCGPAHISDEKRALPESGNGSARDALHRLLRAR